MNPAGEGGQILVTNLVAHDNMMSSPFDEFFIDAAVDAAAGRTAAFRRSSSTSPPVSHGRIKL